MSDERRSKMSASGLERVALCPGSWNLEKDIPDTTNPAAESGTRIHAALSGEAVTLSPNELDVLEAAMELEKRTLDEWKKDGDLPVMVRREHRLWLSNNGQQVFSGQPDVVFLQGDRALCLDMKTGRTAVASSAENYQLTALAVLIGENPAILEVTCGIIAPMVSHKVELVVFDRPALIAARVGILAAIDAAMKPGAELVPGDKQCAWCKARSICPALRAEMKMLSNATIHAPGLTVSNDELAFLLEQRGRVKKLIGDIEAEAVRRIESGQKIDGYELVQAKGKRKVSDVVLVGERLNNAGASWQDIAAASSIGIGNVKDLARAASKLKGVALAKFVDEVLDGAVTVGEGKMRLQKVGTLLEDDES